MLIINYKTNNRKNKFNYKLSKKLKYKAVQVFIQRNKLKAGKKSVMQSIAKVVKLPYKSGTEAEQPQKHQMEV